MSDDLREVVAKALCDASGGQYEWRNFTMAADAVLAAIAPHMPDEFVDAGWRCHPTPDKCRLDHDRNCQEHDHFGEGECPVAICRAALGEQP